MQIALDSSQLPKAIYHLKNSNIQTPNGWPDSIEPNTTASKRKQMTNIMSSLVIFI
jgi:hypothetical protein